MTQYLDYTLSDVQRANLTTLRDYLANPPHAVELWMQYWAWDERRAQCATPAHPCGTPACVVGHGPAAGIPMLPEDLGSFYHYSCRAFIALHHLGARFFAFGTSWPDSIPEAVARLTMVLDGTVPAEWDYDDRYAKTVAA